MEFGICNLSVVPCRKDPSDKSELVTQLLFGDLFKILAQKEKWICIKPLFDEYESWIDIKQCQPLYEEVFESLRDAKTAVATDLVQVLKNNETGHLFPIVAGSSLPHFKNNNLRIDKVNYTYEGSIAKETKPTRDDLTEAAYMFLNTPYLWGGRSPFGIDCSGLTQIAFKMCGIKIPRDAYQQAEKAQPTESVQPFGQGKLLNFIEEAQEGDLAFFDNKEGKIVHVGMVLKEGKIIHASGKVRVDTFDHQGIFNIELQEYTHRLRIIKTFL